MPWKESNTDYLPPPPKKGEKQKSKEQPSVVRLRKKQAKLCKFKAQPGLLAPGRPELHNNALDEKQTKAKAPNQRHPGIFVYV